MTGADDDFGLRPLRREDIGADWDDLPPKRGKGKPRLVNGGDEARARAGYEPPGNNTIPPPPDRDKLSLSSWLKRDIPPRDYLLGGVMCTTSRWFIFGETGIGKTLLAMDMGAAIAAETDFLKWIGQRWTRVMYIDGELRIETFKERMELIAKRYRDDIELYGYNRDALGDDGLPPLNTEAGQAWLRREIDAVKPDVIFFDSIFCLLVGSAREEDTWAPMKPFVRELTRRHIAQVWLHHANESGKSFGDKTREWEMDTVVFLSRPAGEDGEPDEGAIKWEFRKARLKKPSNADQFEAFIVRPGEDWSIETAPKGAARRRGSSQAEIIRSEYLSAYDRLADGISRSHGFDGKLVRKVSSDAVRDELKSRGFLPLDDKGHVEAFGRKLLFRAREELLKGGKLIEKEGMIWRP